MRDESGMQQTEAAPGKVEIVSSLGRIPGVSAGKRAGVQGRIAEEWFSTKV